MLLLARLIVEQSHHYSEVCPLIEIRPTAKIHATVEAPPSKSYTNRAYVVAALAGGEVRLEHPLFSDDTRYMREALLMFGIPVAEEQQAAVVQGQGGQVKVPGGEIFVGNAGTTMRFLTTFSTLAPGAVTLTGDARMQERPIEDFNQGATQNIDSSLRS